MEPDDERGVQASVRGYNWTTIALIGGMVLLMLAIAYFATRGNADQDKLTNANIATSTAPNREKLCASSATYDLIRRELFRRAAQVRGSDQAAYDQISTSAVVRMENPVMENEDSSTGAVHCSGSLSLDLPPGIAVAGDRRTLSADVDYSVQQAADGSAPVVLLENADAIVTALATLSRVSQPAPEPPLPAEENGLAPQTPTASQDQATPQTAAEAPESSAAGPSFSCASARTKGEALVCGDAGLASLDRRMATEYGRASAVASVDQRLLLRDTAHRFYAYRDRCPDRQCIASAYAGRIREIRDIVEDRWQPPR